VDVDFLSNSPFQEVHGEAFFFFSGWLGLEGVLTVGELRCTLSESFSFFTNPSQPLGTLKADFYGWHCKEADQVHELF